jgi:hypothetical protein
MGCNAGVCLLVKNRRNVDSPAAAAASAPMRTTAAATAHLPNRNPNRGRKGINAFVSIRSMFSADRANS